jgi:hypothetical protein
VLDVFAAGLAEQAHGTGEPAGRPRAVATIGEVESEPERASCGCRQSAGKAMEVVRTLECGLEHGVPTRQVCCEAEPPQLVRVQSLLCITPLEILIDGCPVAALPWILLHGRKMSGGSAAGNVIGLSRRTLHASAAP